MVAVARKAWGTKLYSAVEDAIMDICERDLPRGRATAIAFSESPHTIDHRVGWDNIGHIGRKDHDLAFALWYRYARDPVQEVRDDISEYINHVFDIEGGADETFPGGFGISVAEVQFISNTLEQADLGRLPYYDLGNLALARSLGMPEPEGVEVAPFLHMPIVTS